MMISLPYNVHVDIIDWVYRASQHATIDRPTLLACALVCKAWTVPAQRLLFRRTWASHPQEGFSRARRAQFIDAVRRNPVLGKYVHSIANPPYGGFLLHDDLFDLIAHCPNVRALHMPDFQNMERLRVPDLSPVFLSLSGLGDSIAPVSDLWPSLQGLEIDIYFRITNLPIKSPRCLKVDWHNPVSVRWMLEVAVVSEVRELEMAAISWGSESRLCSLAQFPALVQITSLALKGELPPQVILDRCFALEKLVFTRRPWETVVLPRTLQHVGYHAKTDDEDGAPIGTPRGRAAYAAGPSPGDGDARTFRVGPGRAETRV
ncbi:hypothetical protein FA95DRAFT_116546 [Auriscalpium vulgare]|uniref:Uncharacterized protein n=1 Tax=Auriscalpium vulgare TaxID=40419 RepID=A0ACB8RND0_9AGAM|nr:hypothetical protein FA95DRAFT_116546 [Auriscalpium vulgare]